MPPHLIFGTASFGMPNTSFQDAASVRSLLRTLSDLDIRRLDTAARYPPGNPGRSEELIGEALALSDADNHSGSGLRSRFDIDTKIYTDTATDGSGDLKTEMLERSVGRSLGRFGASGEEEPPINVLYSHRHDPGTPLEEQIRGFNVAIEKGQCRSWGISNTPPSTLKQILTLCEKNGWKKPSYYQGVYNLLTRGMESSLLPLLREHGIKFVAFQTLAAGFLTGKFASNNHAGTRFDPSHPLSDAVQKQFGQEGLVNTMRTFCASVEEGGLTPVEVAVRWMVWHSALGEGHGVILGASSEEQVRETVRLIRKGGLDEEVVRCVDAVWESVKGERGGIV